MYLLHRMCNSVYSLLIIASLAVRYFYLDQFNFVTLISHINVIEIDKGGESLRSEIGPLMEFDFIFLILSF
jgi:hypothetical protein